MKGCDYFVSFHSALGRPLLAVVYSYLLTVRQLSTATRALTTMARTEAHRQTYGEAQICLRVRVCMPVCLSAVCLSVGTPVYCDDT